MKTRRKISTAILKKTQKEVGKLNRWNTLFKLAVRETALKRSYLLGRIIRCSLRDTLAFVSISSFCERYMMQILFSILYLIRRFLIKYILLYVSRNGIFNLNLMIGVNRLMSYDRLLQSQQNVVLPDREQDTLLIKMIQIHYLDTFVSTSCHLQ